MLVCHARIRKRTGRISAEIFGPRIFRNRLTLGANLHGLRPARLIACAANLLHASIIFVCRFEAAKRSRRIRSSHRIDNRSKRLDLRYLNYILSTRFGIPTYGSSGLSRRNNMSHRRSAVRINVAQTDIINMMIYRA